MGTVCRFRFGSGVDLKEVEAQLALSVVVAECTYGQPRVRLTAGYFLSNEKLQAVIDVSNETGEMIARVFTGLIIRRFGEEVFTVNRINEFKKEAVC